MKYLLMKVMKYPYVILMIKDIFSPRKILVIFDDMIADVMGNKKFHAIVK